MRLSAMPLGILNLIFSAVATPVPSTATADFSIAPSNGRPPLIKVEFCWVPGGQPVDCQVMSQQEEHCEYHYGLKNYLKSVKMPDSHHFCMVFSDSSCAKDAIFLGTNNDIHAAGVNFPIVSSWCYNGAKEGPIKFPPGLVGRSIDATDSLTSSDSKVTVKLPKPIFLKRDEDLVVRDEASVIHGTSCFDDGPCQKDEWTHNVCVTNFYQYDHIKGFELPEGVYGMIFPYGDKTCKGDTGAAAIFKSTPDLRLYATNLQFPIGSLYFWYSWMPARSAVEAGSIDSSNSIVSRGEVLLFDADVLME